MMELRDRTVLLTGASRGIGAKMAEQLVADGSKVLAVARPSAELEELLRTYRRSVHVFPADLQDPDTPQSVADWVLANHPDCSVLINNAAIMEHLLYTDRNTDHGAAIAREVSINLTAPIRLSVAMLPVLDTSSGAAICNVTSGLSIAPIANAATYCATKAGLRSFTRALRYQCEDAGLNISVSEAVMTLVDTTLSHGDPKRKASPEQAALEVLCGLRSGAPEIWVGKTRLLRIVNRLSPALAARIMRGRTPN